MDRRHFLTTSALLAAGGVLSACGKDSAAETSEGAAATAAATPGTVKVVYQKYGNFTQIDTLFKDVKKQFEAENSGSTLELIPIEAAQNDYITKLALMNRSATTAPDLMYEDSFMVRSDVDAGYLLKLDDYLSGWSEWGQFVDAAKEAGKADDGGTYGVSLGTDTRGIWYNKELLTKAGINADGWQPKNWDELLAAADAVKSKVPGVIPLNVYSGKPNGEGSVMQGFEMLLYGTENGTLYKGDEQKWVVGSQQFKDSLAFIEKIYTSGLAPKPQQALDANIGSVVSGQWIPKGKLAINVDGSWMPGTWLPTGNVPWKEWDKVMGWGAMPTQNGQGSGKVSMSGGWLLSMGANCKNPGLGFKVMTIALDKKHSLMNYTNNSQISVRKDCSEDPTYLSANPSVKFFTDLVSDTVFRPATADYPEISTAIAAAMEAVMTGQQSVDAAASAYDEAVIGQVGEENTAKG